MGEQNVGGVASEGIGKGVTATSANTKRQIVLRSSVGSVSSVVLGRDMMDMLRLRWIPMASDQGYRTGSCRDRH